MRTVLVVGVGSLLAMMTWAGSPACAGDAETTGRAASRVEAERLPRLYLIAPGTKVGKSLPTGWSHLVLKSIPKLESGAISSLPAVGKSTAALFRTVVLADVRSVGEERTGFELDRVGMGISLSVNGVDTIVSATKPGLISPPLGVVARRVLGRVEAELAKGRIKARTLTFALYSTPAKLKVDGAHVSVLLRYALMVDPETGALRTIVWPIHEDPSTRQAPERVYLLPSSLTFTCGLDVATARLLETIPAYWSFAMVKLPPGQAIPVPPKLRPWLLRDALTPTESATLESELRLAVANAGPERSDGLATRPAPVTGAGERRLRGPMR